MEFITKNIKKIIFIQVYSMIDLITALNLS